MGREEKRRERIEGRESGTFEEKLVGKRKRIEGRRGEGNVKRRKWKKSGIKRGGRTKRGKENKYDKTREGKEKKSGWRKRRRIKEGQGDKEKCENPTLQDIQGRAAVGSPT